MAEREERLKDWKKHRDEFKKLGKKFRLNEKPDAPNFDQVITPDTWGEIIQGVEGVKLGSPKMQQFNMNGGLYSGKAGLEFGRHRHDDHTEVIVMLSGKMLDRERNKILMAGDVVTYVPGVPHWFNFLEDSMWVVTWSPAIKMVPHLKTEE